MNMSAKWQPWAMLSAALKSATVYLAEGHITCGHCRNCRAGGVVTCVAIRPGVGVNRPGAFAEYLVIPAENAFKLPDNISDDMGGYF